MSQEATDSTCGVIDSTLDYIVMSFMLGKQDIASLPNWLIAEIPTLALKRPKIERLLDNLERENGFAISRHSHNKVDFGASRHSHDPNWEFFDPDPQFFIGEKKKRVKSATVPKLPQQLAELGFVPIRRKVYLKDSIEGKPRYILNIYWNRRTISHDTEAVTETIHQNSSFVFEWSVKNSWSIKGLEFNVNSHVILLDFRYRVPTLPSQRQYEIVVINNQLQVARAR